MATGALTNTTRRQPGQGAVSPTDAARAISPEDSARITALMQAAGRAHGAGNRDRLKAILQEILEIDPGHANATYNLGILYRDEDDVFQAEVHLRRALKLDPGLIDGYQALADLLFTVTHTLTAAKIYEDALELAPNRLPLLHNLAKTRMMLKDAPE